MIDPTPTIPASRGPSATTEKLRETAIKLEASFLAEMLKHTGLGATPDGFGGGVGEEQFSSFLRQEQANLMAHRGGIGLAETIFQALSRSASND
ncbi:rod-binding protein [Thioclava sp. A2]|uniref:rod-binding protein n=1 Tax=Thioclava sp. FCG-A2 TaxID=3080562 RepID=UPI0029539455|nr:rod-binding protein [Thioclava sp. A2]MDV7270675.1 rod-binding protein [Thioclava sp. A2]